MYGTLLMFQVLPQRIEFEYIREIAHSSFITSFSSRRTYDQCRHELTNKVTISPSSFCKAHANFKEKNRNVALDPFDWIERTIYEHVSLFEEAASDISYNTVVIPNGLCQMNCSIDSQDITLTTHLTPDKANRLIALARRWNGPMSVAVKISGINELRQFRSEVNDHLGYLHQSVFHFYFESRNREYPNNILRNLAIDHVKSDYFVFLDVDFFPSPLNTHGHLKSALLLHPSLEADLKNKALFVMPAFELHEKVDSNDFLQKHPHFPNTRNDLIQMMNSPEQKVGVFHCESCTPGHRSTNYSKWSSNLRDVSYSTRILEFGYEPYVLGSIKGIPKFYEDFRGYGLNKLSYFVELFYANYSLKVLRDFFVFHLDHPSTYGNQGRDSYRTNLNCSKFFVKYLTEKYGAGTLSNHEEVAGWNVWKRLRDRHS